MKTFQKKTFQKKSFQKSNGFSLVELMIAGILGLLLLAAVINLFSGTRSSFRIQEQLANVQTDGRFALMFMERYLENAGWFEELAPTFASGIDFTNSSEGGGTNNDSITVQQEAVAGAGIDCNGATVTGTVVTNTFSVNGTTLQCLGNGSITTPQPLIENVESFQVMYGVDTDKNGVVDQYMTAAQVSGGSHQSKVVAIQFALVIATQDEVMPNPQNHSLDALGVTINTNDKRLRRVFSKTISLPNQAFAIINTQKK